MTSRRVMRAVVGATWSIPLRLFTIPAIAGAMVVAAGGSLALNDLWQPTVVLSGVATSATLRLADNLAVEFAVFPATLKLFTRKGEAS